MSNPTLHSLTIVIPALDEEDAIAETVERCIAARQHIQQTAGVADVEIIVVSDGSTDRTAEIAQTFDEVQTIVFPINQGYGAAIKEGWRVGRGNLLGFLDADGTCDPRYFAIMCKQLIQNQADVVLGSRLGADSQMPRVRRIGNRMYALLLGVLCGQYVTDTASGMRVVRRSAIPNLYPLPDGLHFTPAMSARALLNNLRVVEIPMRYEERVGASKLSVVRDGVRFLQAIFAGVLCYRPERLLLFLFAGCALITLTFGVAPIEFYLGNGRVEEWMIYRFVVCGLASSVGLLLLLAIALANRMADFGPRQRGPELFWPGAISALIRGRILAVAVLCLACASLWCLWPGIVEYSTRGTVTLHWSRLLAGAFGLLSVVHILLFAFLLKVTNLWRANADEFDGGASN